MLTNACKALAKHWLSRHHPTFGAAYIGFIPAQELAILTTGINQKVFSRAFGYY